MPRRLKFDMNPHFSTTGTAKWCAIITWPLGAGLIIEGRLIGAVKIYEPRQSQDNVLKNTECYDGNGDTCNDNVAAECKYNESGKKG